MLSRYRRYRCYIYSFDHAFVNLSKSACFPYVHCVCALYVHCMSTVCALYVHCILGRFSILMRQGHSVVKSKDALRKRKCQLWGSNPRAVTCSGSEVHPLNHSSNLTHVGRAFPPPWGDPLQCRVWLLLTTLWLPRGPGWRSSRHGGASETRSSVLAGTQGRLTTSEQRVCIQSGPHMASLPRWTPPRSHHLSMLSAGRHRRAGTRNLRYVPQSPSDRRARPQH